jgi:hypothetical protein
MLGSDKLRHAVQGPLLRIRASPGTVALPGGAQAWLRGLAANWERICGGRDKRVRFDAHVTSVTEVTGVT